MIGKNLSQIIQFLNNLKIKKQEFYLIKNMKSLQHMYIKHICIYYVIMK